MKKSEGVSLIDKHKIHCNFNYIMKKIYIKNKSKRNMKKRKKKKRKKMKKIMMSEWECEMESMWWCQVLKKKLQERLRQKEEALSRLHEQQLAEAVHGCATSFALKIRRVILTQKHIMEMEQFRWDTSDPHSETHHGDRAVQVRRH